ncbi:hypothetical protein EDB83DRAFT_1563427 [Lactarius deliciosus]|nr:hypothetical protein EDB83DRAFT_1563427 [Lactarius deliciosus]
MGVAVLFFLWSLANLLRGLHMMSIHGRLGRVFKKLLVILSKEVFYGDRGLWLANKNEPCHDSNVTPIAPIGRVHRRDIGQLEGAVLGNIGGRCVRASFLAKFRLSLTVPSSSGLYACIISSVVARKADFAELCRSSCTMPGPYIHEALARNSRRPLAQFHRG